MSGAELLEERRGDSGEIVWLTLNRPQARNALTFAMYDRIREVCLEVDADPSVRAVVFTGAGGRAFAAGTDISQFRAFDKKEDALAYEERMDGVLGALESMRVPAIAAITGACTGGGAGIAAACDLRVCTPTLKFGFPMARTTRLCARRCSRPTASRSAGDSARSRVRRGGSGSWGTPRVNGR